MAVRVLAKRSSQSHQLTIDKQTHAQVDAMNEYRIYYY